VPHVEFYIKHCAVVGVVKENSDEETSSGSRNGFKTANVNGKITTKGRNSKMADRSSVDFEPTVTTAGTQILYFHLFLLIELYVFRCYLLSTCK